MQIESKIERERRSWVERQEKFRDAQEEYERQLAQAQTEIERRRLMDNFSAYRRTHKEEDVRSGKRPPGTEVTMHQIMWARWIEIAVDNERPSSGGVSKNCC